MITHGQLITEGKGVELREAGVGQITFSLDFACERHDISRGIRGLFHHITTVIRKLKARGIDNISFNAFMMRNNLDDIIPIARLGQGLGVCVSYSSYFEGKANNATHTIVGDDLKRVEGVVEELMRFTRTHRTIRNSNFYLRKIPAYFKEPVPSFQAGLAWFQVTPGGYLQRHSEFPVEAHRTEYTPNTFRPTGCTACWFSCRGEAEARLTPGRIIELNR